jgi:hypothetical protein
MAYLRATYCQRRNPFYQYQQKQSDKLCEEIRNKGTDATALAKLRSLTVAQIVRWSQESAGAGGHITYSGPILDANL